MSQVLLCVVPSLESRSDCTANVRMAMGVVSGELLGLDEYAEDK